MKAILPIALAALWAAPALAETDPVKIAAICTEAEERYAEIYGHPSADAEGVEVVLMYKYTFCPVEVEVPAGTTIRWVNVDKRTSHSTWFRDAGEPESERLFPEETAEQTFDIPGEWGYLCGPHWESRDMIGKVIVKP
ncbi:plastocyanin/azurin family copper-binding protein [Sinirhodobacter sp. WL0062]|uniref:Plastocyanin/azurin family copper-binding protein n=1 Tax=Rhodobacter flavimaris TaxID=2907145 RepID=A0ABS8YXD3_9RHOB|nr:plastocyanin/azurin family copper-binding protein [Sinirhodobacter sp. WL0062]MCE5973800.1 plastocyanin/azurin family copper-binding protein [Sinirhodobacter sp. WL0062]